MCVCLFNPASGCHMPIIPVCIRSSDVITLSCPPSSSSPKVNNRSFHYASPCFSFPRNFACLMITDLSLSSDLTHVSSSSPSSPLSPSIRLLLLTSTPGSRLIFSTNPFPIVLLHFHPSGSGQSVAAKRILVHFRHKFAPFWVPKWRTISCVFFAFPLGLVFQWGCSVLRPVNWNVPLHDPPTFNNSFCSLGRGDRPLLKPWWGHGQIGPLGSVFLEFHGR